jgi:hypothetical protein
MTNAALVEAFYTQVSDFLGELSTVFPHDLEFPAYRAQFYLMKRTNPSLPLKQLGLYAPMLEPVLATRNAESFLTCDVPAGLEPLVEKLRGYWLFMTPENQSVVWGYLRLLTAIATRYTA